MRSVVPSTPGQLLSVDFYGPLPATKGGFKYILSTIDNFSKFVRLYTVYCILYTLRSATSKNALAKLTNDYSPKFGKPERIIWDHGTQFTSKNWLDALAKEGVRVSFSSIGHAQGNMVERIHRELSRFFHSLIEEKHNSWWKWVSIIEN